MLVHWEKTIAFIGPLVNKLEYAIDVALDPVEPLNLEIGLITLQWDLSVALDPIEPLNPETGLFTLQWD